jgi:hypothetical protein
VQIRNGRSSWSHQHSHNSSYDWRQLVGMGKYQRVTGYPTDPSLSGEANYERYVLEFYRRAGFKLHRKYHGEDWFKEMYLGQGGRDSDEAVAIRAAAFSDLLQQTPDRVSFINANCGPTAEPALPTDSSPSSAASASALSSSSSPASSSNGTSAESPPVNNCIRMGFVPRWCTRGDLESLFQSQKGFKKLILSPARDYNDYERKGLIYYDSRETCLKALDRFSGFELTWDEGRAVHFLQLKPSEEPVCHMKATPDSAYCDADRVQHDLSAVVRLATLLNVQRQVGSVEGARVVEFLGQSGQNGWSKLQLLNAGLAYLREVHYCCYYCGRVFASEEDMFHACGEHHARFKTRATNGDFEDADAPATPEGWALAVDKRSAELLAGSHSLAKSAQTGQAEAENGALLSEEQFRAEFVRKHTTDTVFDGDKISVCSICSTPFEAAHFVEGHIARKHDEVVRKQYNDLVMSSEFKQFLPIYVQQMKAKHLKKKELGYHRRFRRSVSRDRQQRQRKAATSMDLSAPRTTQDGFGSLPSERVVGYGDLSAAVEEKMELDEDTMLLF